MKLCEVCGVRMATYTAPKIGVENGVVFMCEHCLKELFDQTMAERAKATIQ